MNIIKYSSLVVILAFTVGCQFTFTSGIPGSGISMSESREVDTFDKIELDGMGTVNVKFGDQQMVDITTDDNLVDLIETRVVDGKLIIRPTESINPEVDLIVDITVKQLSSVEIDGAGKINVNKIDGDKLELSIDGAGKIEGDGQVNSLTVEISGAGTANVKDLKAKTVKVDLSGAGSASVYASDSFDGEVSGVGSIKCHGNPADVKKNVSGIGNINVPE